MEKTKPTLILFKHLISSKLTESEKSVQGNLPKFEKLAEDIIEEIKVSILSKKKNIDKIILNTKYILNLKSYENEIYTNMLIMIVSGSMGNDLEGFNLVEQKANNLTKNSLDIKSKNEIYKCVISILILKGADINYANSIGRTPLHFAATNMDHGDIAVQTLIEHKAILEVKDQCDTTPLGLANSNPLCYQKSIHAFNECLSPEKKLGKNIILRNNINIDTATTTTPSVEVLGKPIRPPRPSKNALPFMQNGGIDEAQEKNTKKVQSLIESFEALSKSTDPAVD